MRGHSGERRKAATHGASTLWYHTEAHLFECAFCFARKSGLEEEERKEMQHTPLFDRYRSQVARWTSFAGFEMPLYFQSILAEHHTVRQKWGLFDVSHMGEWIIDGEAAAQLLDVAFSRNTTTMRPGSARYGFLLWPNGGTVDDAMVYRLQPDRFLLVANAANIAKDGEALRRAAEQAQVESGAKCYDRSAEIALLAAQGPAAIPAIEQASGTEIGSIRPFRAAQRTLWGHTVLISRTGYTGEDGVEIFSKAEEAGLLWEKLLEAGAVPCGLGARDTLRLEAALPLYGHELTDTITPLEADLEKFVDWDHPFIGREALEKQRQIGPEKKRIGLVLTERGIAREGMKLYAAGEPAGWVTSGTQSPTLGQSIALAYLQSKVLSEAAETALAVEIRGRMVSAQRATLPFVQRGRSAVPQRPTTQGGRGR